MSPFYAFDLFKEHLLSHTKSFNYNCQKCQTLLVDADDIIKHFLFCSGVGRYHCVFCRFGTNEFSKIDEHIANKHSSQMPIFCERVSASGFTKVKKSLNFSSVYLTIAFLVE